MNAAYRVYYTEYERGWGSRPDGHKDFQGASALEDAKQHIITFNSTNNLPSAPDWYMIASGPVLVDLDNS
jgi:hypothetical protein